MWRQVNAQRARRPWARPHGQPSRGCKDRPQVRGRAGSPSLTDREGSPTARSRAAAASRRRRPHGQPRPSRCPGSTHRPRACAPWSPRRAHHRDRRGCPPPNPHWTPPPPRPMTRRSRMSTRAKLLARELSLLRATPGEQTIPARDHGIPTVGARRTIGFVQVPAPQIEAATAETSIAPEQTETSALTNKGQGDRATPGATARSRARGRSVQCRPCSWSPGCGAQRLPARPVGAWTLRRLSYWIPSVGCHRTLRQRRASR